jgi:hypothetical protein
MCGSVPMYPGHETDNFAKAWRQALRWLGCANDPRAAGGDLLQPAAVQRPKNSAALRHFSN